MCLIDDPFLIDKKLRQHIIKTAHELKVKTIPREKPWNLGTLFRKGQGSGKSPNFTGG